MFGLETSQRCGKRVETNIQKVSGANSYYCKNYRVSLFATPILMRVKNKLNENHEKGY